VAQGLILVADSSAWIAALRSKPSPAKVMMLDAINNHTILIPDLVLAEVLRGARTEREAKVMAAEFDNLQTVDVVGASMARKAAAHFRYLRAKGITVRGTVDLLIATWCIETDLPLLHDDRDYLGFEKHLGLRRWPTSQ
jgi:predicted nucleic acid-binding protein